MSKRFNRSVMALVSVLMIGLSACEHDNFDNFVGPSIDCSLYEGLEVLVPLTLSSEEIDFSSGNLVAQASFTQEVNWTLTIVGTESGAQKTLTGTGAEIAASWDGSTDNFLFFQTETCVLTLEVGCIDEVMTASVLITTTKDHPGYLFSDFDGEGTPATSWWATYKNPLEEKLVFAADSTGGAPQGDYYLHYSGQDVDGDGYLAVGGHNGSFVTGMSGDNDQVYVNALVRATSTTDVELRVVESDGDEYFKRVLVDWEGWNLISFPYSESELRLVGSGGTAGTQSSDLISRMKIGLRASPANSLAELHIDYIILTENGPLVP